MSPLLLGEASSGLKGYLTQLACYFRYLNIPGFFKIVPLHWKLFLLKGFEPDWVKCWKMSSGCLTSILFLFTTLIFSVERNFVRWLTVIYALPSSTHNVEFNIKTLYVEKGSVTYWFFPLLSHMDVKILTYLPTALTMLYSNFQQKFINHCFALVKVHFLTFSNVAHSVSRIQYCENLPD